MLKIVHCVSDEVTTSKSDEEVDNTEQTTTATTDQNVQEDLIEATPVEEIQIDPIKVDSDDDEKNSTVSQTLQKSAIHSPRSL